MQIVVDSREQAPFTFAGYGSREGAEYMTLSFLEKYATEQHKRLRAIVTALEGSDIIPDAKTPENAA